MWCACVVCMCGVSVVWCACVVCVWCGVFWLHSRVVCPRELVTSTGSTSNGCSQYSANMQHTVFSTTLALVRSVAVHSMNTSLVATEI